MGQFSFKPLNYLVALRILNTRNEWNIVADII